MSLSDFSKSNAEAVVHCVTLQIDTLLESSTSQPPLSKLEIQRVFRLPYLLVDAGIDFAKRFEAACQKKASEIPGRPLPDPWDEKSEQRLYAAIDRAMRIVETRVVRNWAVTQSQAKVLASLASSELQQWLTEEFEKGRDAYWATLEAARSTSPAADKASGIAPADVNPRQQKPRQPRGKTTDERLRSLLETPDGVSKVLAAGNANGVARLIDRSRTAVIESTVWKVSVLPLLETARAFARDARREFDADRRS